jgi:hypothetical protein
VISTVALGLGKISHGKFGFQNGSSLGDFCKSEPNLMVVGGKW